MRELYGFRTIPKGYRIVKFDEWLEVQPESIYELTVRRGWVHCPCHQGNKETCRHREMLKLFIQMNRVDKGWFYEYSASKWIAPITTRRRKL